jgi:hypothetical protein
VLDSVPAAEREPFQNGQWEMPQCPGNVHFLDCRRSGLNPRVAPQLVALPAQNRVGAELPVIQPEHRKYLYINAYKRIEIHRL